jgi:hypothetical protein
MEDDEVSSYDEVIAGNEIPSKSGPQARMNPLPEKILTKEQIEAKKLADALREERVTIKMAAKNKGKGLHQVDLSKGALDHLM